MQLKIVGLLGKVVPWKKDLKAFEAWKGKNRRMLKQIEIYFHFFKTKFMINYLSNCKTLHVIPFNHCINKAARSLDFDVDKSS